MLLMHSQKGWESYQNSGYFWETRPKGESEPSERKKANSKIAIWKQKLPYKHVLQSSIRKAAKLARNSEKIQEKVFCARDVNKQLMDAEIKNESAS